MKKILLIEDRPGRQAQLLTEKDFDALVKIDNLDRPNADECVKLIDEINNENAQIEQYDLIIIHKSSLNQTGLEFLKTLKKDLIIFSGGLSQFIYQYDDFPILSVNSADLYNSNFINFIRKYINGYITNLSELIYGEKWKLNLLLSYRLLKTKLDHSTDEYEKVELTEQLNSIKTNIENFNKEDIDKEIDKEIKLL